MADQRSKLADKFLSKHTFSLDNSFTDSVVTCAPQETCSRATITNTASSNTITTINNTSRRDDKGYPFDIVRQNASHEDAPLSGPSAVNDDSSAKPSLSVYNRESIYSTITDGSISPTNGSTTTALTTEQPMQKCRPDGGAGDGKDDMKQTKEALTLGNAATVQRWMMFDGGNERKDDATLTGEADDAHAQHRQQQVKGKWRDSKECGTMTDDESTLQEFYNSLMATSDNISTVPMHLGAPEREFEHKHSEVKYEPLDKRNNNDQASTLLTKNGIIPEGFRIIKEQQRQIEDKNCAIENGTGRNSNLPDVANFTNRNICSGFCQFCDLSEPPTAHHERPSRLPTTASQDEKQAPPCCSCCCRGMSSTASRKGVIQADDGGLSSNNNNQNDDDGFEAATKSQNYVQMVTSKVDHRHTKSIDAFKGTVLSSRCVKTNERIKRICPMVVNVEGGTELDDCDGFGRNDDPTINTTEEKVKINRPKDGQILVSGQPTNGDLNWTQQRGGIVAVERTELTKLSQSKPLVTSIMPCVKHVTRLPDALPTTMTAVPKKAEQQDEDNNIGHYRFDNSSGAEGDDHNQVEIAEKRPNASHPTYMDKNNMVWRRRKKRKTYQENRVRLPEAVPKTADVQRKSDSAGWSVTVAGSYHPNMAPDLEMRLSFPKTATPATTTIADPVQGQRDGYAKPFTPNDFMVTRLPLTETMHPLAITQGPAVDESSIPDLDLCDASEGQSNEDDVENGNGGGIQEAAGVSSLPAINIQPKRSLMRATPTEKRKCSDF